MLLRWITASGYWPIWAARHNLLLIPKGLPDCESYNLIMDLFLHLFQLFWLDYRLHLLDLFHFLSIKWIPFFLVFSHCPPLFKLISLVVDHLDDFLLRFLQFEVLCSELRSLLLNLLLDIHIHLSLKTPLFLLLFFIVVQVLIFIVHLLFGKYWILHHRTSRHGHHGSSECISKIV